MLLAADATFGTGYLRDPLAKLRSEMPVWGVRTIVTEFRPVLADMVTVVEIDKETKSRLKELQTEVRLRTGTTVTEQELVEQLVEDAYERKSAFVDSFQSTTVPLTEDEKETMASGRFSPGVETNENHIDDVLYE